MAILQVRKSGNSKGAFASSASATINSSCLIRLSTSEPDIFLFGAAMDMHSCSEWRTCNVEFAPSADGLSRNEELTICCFSPSGRLPSPFCPLSAASGRVHTSASWLKQAVYTGKPPNIRNTSRKPTTDAENFKCPTLQ